MLRTKTKCHICDGTGFTVHMRSWFRTDGHYRVRCGICAGSGVSSYRDHSYAAEQAKLRQAANAGASS